MDWHAWTGQHISFTEIRRGGATVWLIGGKGLLDDSLGPILHSHDRASEIFYFIAGRCRLEVGDSEEFFGPGDFILVPPDVPHNLWNAGDDNLLVFWLVVPNFARQQVAHGWLSTGCDEAPRDARACGSGRGAAERCPNSQPHYHPRYG